MLEKNTDKITAYDRLFTTNTIQILKIILPYLPPASQKGLAVSIKYLEFRYTLALLERHPYLGCMTTPHKAGDFSQLFEEILPLCSSDAKAQVLKLQSLLQNMENMQEMLEMIQTIQELFPDGDIDLASFMGGQGDNMDLSQIINLFQKET